MTTGRINQVAIGAAEAVRDDSDERPTDVQSPFRSSHESSYTDRVVTRPFHQRHSLSGGRSISLEPTEQFSVRLPNTRFEVGICKTVKVQVP